MVVTSHQPVPVQASIPELITKELGLLRVGENRKVRLSTNFLPLIGFEAGTRHRVDVLGPMAGLRLSFDAAGPQKVYQRKYSSRRNNPFETVVEIGRQPTLDAAFPGYTERLHFSLRHGEIIIRPLANRTFAIRRRLAVEPNPFEAMIAMTSGVDVRCLQDTGFSINSVLEYRPQEARDSRDLTESGVLTVLANAAPRIVFNEDISKIDWANVARAMDGGPQLAMLHISLQCDEFSTVKAKSLKQKALDDLTTTQDLVYDALRLVETARPALVMLEQVAGFATSGEGNLLRTKLRKWGYHVTEAILKADQFGGRTGRQRLYLIASVFPGFEMPQPGTGDRMSLWNDIEPYLASCRDISHTKTLQDGVATGRARFISPGSTVSPTILKSQLRQAKDSVFIKAADGRYLFPSNELLAFLNGIPSDFNFNSVASEQCGEQIGQSIDYPMHEAVCRAAHAHIAANVGLHTIVKITPSAPIAPSRKEPTAQMGLFE